MKINPTKGDRVSGYTLERYTFGVYPTALDDSFESFVIDVPTTNGADAAARRAWWQVFHLLGAQGFEPEQFTVCEWRNDQPGRLVTMGGFVDLTHAPAGAAA